MRALGGDFPFYGTMETTPASGRARFREGRRARRRRRACSFNFTPGRAIQIKIGDVEFTIAGALKKMPGEASAGRESLRRAFTFRCKISPRRNLLKPGSVARYRAYVKFPPRRRCRAANRKRSLRKSSGFGLEYDTVAKRKKDLGEALDNLYRFLNLVGFISLLLGAVGVASAIQAHLQQKTQTGAILRCLGASARTTVFVYLLQAAAMGLVGAVAGAGSRRGDAADLPAHPAERSFRSRFPTRSPGSRSVRGMS